MCTDIGYTTYNYYYYITRLFSTHGLTQVSMDGFWKVLKRSKYTWSWTLDLSKV